MRYILAFFFLTFFKTMYSQDASLEAYFYEWHEFKVILLLGCNQGYLYSGPHLFIDEVFNYKVKGNKIIRSFDPEYSLRKRVDTLLVKKRSLLDINRLSFKKVNSKKRDELIRKYIEPSIGVGFYSHFLKKISFCKEEE